MDIYVPVLLYTKKLSLTAESSCRNVCCCSSQSGIVHRHCQACHTQMYRSGLEDMSSSPSSWLVRRRRYIFQMSWWRGCKVIHQRLSSSIILSDSAIFWQLSGDQTIFWWWHHECRGDSGCSTPMTAQWRWHHQSCRDGRCSKPVAADLCGWRHSARLRHQDGALCDVHLLYTGMIHHSTLNQQTCNGWI
jgi:hypothetical protein